MKIKVCSKCKQDKPFDQFHKDKNGKFGLFAYCKECKSAIRKVNYDEKICPVCRKAFIPKMIDSLTCGDLKCVQKYSNSKRKGKRSEYNKKYHKENYHRYRDKMLVRVKEYNVEHKEDRDSYHKQWRDKNKDKIKSYYNPEKRNLYEKERRATDISYRLTCNLRKRISKLVKRQSKTSSTLDLLGCSLDDFLSHLEMLFEDEMSFNNYGEWEVDHIIPCSYFDLSKTENQKSCFHYTNLQPLWKADNLQKSNNLI